MTITQKNGNDGVVFAFEGRIDSQSAPEAEKYFEDIAANGNIVFDFSEVSYISSAGLRFILSVQKRLKDGGSLVIRKPGDMVYEVFEITGFTSILSIER